MAIIKCKMCGGDIEISADKTFGTCEYCGSTMTLPKVDDEQRAAAFNRGNHFRRSGEFDKALAVYERIVAEDDNDAEAHWCCALCRFGIEYVEDPATYEWLPTCHRASFDSFLEDVDYLAAVAHSDGITRRQYQKDAAKIAEVQRGILATSQNEQPFDVFLCYKETGEDGQRTRDSLMAQEVYYELTEQGYRVFFARITLEDKAGAEYEPYIFAALNSAKVMVVIGTKPEHFNAVWVKNEWSRFLSMMKKDRSKLLLPCYRDMDPYDLPEALSVLQSYDMSKIGFMQDLIRGVKKVLDAGKPQEAAKETVKETVVVHNEGGSNVQALLKRGNMALEDGEWSKADEFFEQVLNQDAECGAAYLGKFLSSRKAKSVQAYLQSCCKRIASNAPTAQKSSACEEDSAFIDACVKKYQVPDYYTPEDIHKALTHDRLYCADRAAYFREAQKEFNQALSADRNFVRAEKFADSETKAQCGTLRSETMTLLRQQEQQAEQEAAAEKQRVTEAYHAFLRETEPKLAEKQKQGLAKQEEDQKRKEEFERLRAEQKKRAEEAEKLAAQEAALKAAKAAKAKKLTLICAAVAAAVIAVVLIVTQVIIPSANYSKAEKLLTAGDYDSAITAFAALGNYKDAAEKITQAKEQKENERLAKEAAEEEARNAQAYADAEALLASGDYDGAIAAFTDLGEYQDAADRVKAIEAQKAEEKAKKVEAKNAQAYQEAVSLLESGNYSKASDAFAKLGSYKDAAIRRKECQYQMADQLQNDGDTAAAAVTFGKACGFNDAKERSLALWNVIAKRDVIAASWGYTVGVKADGTVVATGENDDGQCNVSKWKDIIAVAAGYGHTVGLKADGTVVATGNNDDGQCNVSGWSNIVAVAAGSSHTVGLKIDGTVVTAGSTICGESNWSDIISIAANTIVTVGLKTDGTVVDKPSWYSITAVAAGGVHTVGLKMDGTVIATGSNDHRQCNVSDWNNIIAVAAGTDHTVAVKSNGTVVAAGENEDGQCNVSGWSSIIAVAAGFDHTVGLKSDGTVVAAGDNYYGQCNVSNWKNIKLPN